VLKTDTPETENPDKAISFDQKGESMYSLQLSGHMSTKWLTVAPPYIPDAVVPAPHLAFVQVKGSQSPSVGYKAWGWVRAYSLASNGIIQESRIRNRAL
jgi:hypothetical protein